MTSFVTAREIGLVCCPACRQVCRVPATQTAPDCPRCGAALQSRKPASITRTWALLCAAAITYVPANALPILYTRRLHDEREDTILSGVVALWERGSWDLAVIVFVASVVVPLAKIASLALLLLSVQLGWASGPRRRTRLYRLLAAVGHWSMLDLFVVVLLVALVQFSTFARVDPGPGAVAFGVVVVLTTLASQAFDPRLIWDAAGSQAHD